jgi:CheY-like chemotaxis protein
MKALMMLEDESPVRELLRHILTGWSLNVATNMEHALKLFIACDRQVDLLLADVTLPAGSGIQVALLLRSVLPALPVILTTRYPVSAWSVRDFLDLEKLGPNMVTILHNPIPASLLINAISELLGQAQVQRTKTA